MKKKIKLKQKKGISIRTQLFIGLLLPVLFIIVVGITSYMKASEGLIANYESSSMSALEMTVTTLDESMKSILASTSELSQDFTVSSYALGGLGSDTSKQNQAKKSIRNNLNVKQTSNDMIQSIHIIPIMGNAVITSETLNTSEIDSFMSGLLQSGDKGLLADKYVHWGSNHPYIDKSMGISNKNYILYCSKCITSGNEKSLIVVDISRDAVQSLLKQLDFGEDVQVSFITADGQELKSSNQISILDTDCYKVAKNQFKNTISEYVNYKGTEYYFMMSKSNTTGGFVTVMVPKSDITKNSRAIGEITVLLVVIACIIAISISSLIISSISKNIKKSVAKLDKVADGELLEEEAIHRTTRNEFGKLHVAISNSVRRMRELVLTVKKMIGTVSISGEKVSNSCKNVNIIVTDMSMQIEEIQNIIERENMEIASCNGQMEELSGKIKKVNSSVVLTMEEIAHSQQMLTKGISVVEVMTQQSNETSAITDEVQNQVLRLGEKLADISAFVDSIQSIAEETNLLSLNASIEAARAGENGKGFSVVAEEIRKLADDSANTAHAIQALIEEIRLYSGNAIEKVRSAEDIVALQVESVANTADVFRGIHTFMDNLILSMEQVNLNVEEMNRERKDALTSIRAIRELSEDTVQTTTKTGRLLEEQIQSAAAMEEEAKNLEENMLELESAVANFKLNGMKEA